MAKAIVSIFVVFFIFFLVISGKQTYSPFLDIFVYNLKFTLMFWLQISLTIAKSWYDHSIFS